MNAVMRYAASVAICQDCMDSMRITTHTGSADVPEHHMPSLSAFEAAHKGHDIVRAYEFGGIQQRSERRYDEAARA